MDSIKNSANFEVSFIYFYEHYAWFRVVGICLQLGGGFGQERDFMKVLHFEAIPLAYPVPTALLCIVKLTS